MSEKGFFVYILKQKLIFWGVNGLDSEKNITGASLKE